jgi:hypothetical protein
MNARSLPIVVARLALTGWLLLVAFVAFASLIANPAPFVLFAFVIGASPLSLVMRRHPWTHLIWVALAAATLPFLLLVSYGSDDGGVSGARDTIVLALSLAMLGYGLGCIGYALGRIVWSPRRSLRDEPGARMAAHRRLPL